MRFADVGMGKRAPRTERKLQTDRDTCRPDLREHAIRLLLSPASWRSYTILTGQWDGMVRSTSQMIQVPSITIRNSKWTRENPYQDIPILNFKPEVWRKVEDAKITVGAGAIRAKRAGPKQPICVRAACPVNLRLRKRVPGRIRDLVEALHSVTLYLVVPPSDISKTRPLRHFHWLLHNDIERDHEAENDRKEVDRQRRDVGCGAVLEAC
jgi:hypothetical protein